MAVLHQHNMSLYLSAGVAPWGKYPLIYYNLYTTQARSELLEQLFADLPDTIFMPITSPFGRYQDSWEYFRLELPKKYRLGSTVGAFEVWHASIRAD